MAKIESGVASAIKVSNMTIYLSCSNVNSLQTFCEVKLKVCVSVHYEVVVIWRTVCMGGVLSISSHKTIRKKMVRGILSIDQIPFGHFPVINFCVCDRNCYLPT